MFSWRARWLGSPCPLWEFQTREHLWPSLSLSGNRKDHLCVPCQTRRPTPYDWDFTEGKQFSKKLETLAFGCCNWGGILWRYGAGPASSVLLKSQNPLQLTILSGRGSRAEREDRRGSVRKTLISSLGGLLGVQPPAKEIWAIRVATSLCTFMELRPTRSNVITAVWVGVCVWASVYAYIHLDSQEAKTWPCWTSIKLQTNFSDIILLHE